MYRIVVVLLLTALVVIGCANQMPSRGQQIVDSARPMIFPSLSSP